MNAVSQFSAFQPGKSSLTTAERVARGLGWFSIALGITELVAPGKLARAFGLEGRETLLRAYGVREIGAGIGALSIDPGPAVWSRVGGDALDLATLVGGLKGDDQQRRNAFGALGAVVAIAALDIIVATLLTGERKRETRARDFGSRSGFPGGADAARGMASNFETPPEYRAAPAALAAS